MFKAFDYFCKWVECFLNQMEAKKQKKKKDKTGKLIKRKYKINTQALLTYAVMTTCYIHQ